QVNQDKTFSNQSRLPKLPVPTLEETTTKYLHSLRPLLSDKDFAKNEAHIKDFLKPNGLGRILQQRLIDIDRISPNNWLDDTWWIKKAYQEWRVSLVINSNWFFLFFNDSNTPREYFSIDNGVKPRGHFSEFQLAYSPHPNSVKYILIIVKNQFYILDGYDKSGIRLTAGDIEKQLNDIIADVKKAQIDPPVGILTADDRDSWTMSRERLLAISPQNRETLTFIENSLFAVNLDDYATGTDLDKFLGNIFHGFDGHNRWFDKEMSIIVDSNGRAGMNGEHSPCDALIPAFASEWILKEPTSLNAQLSGRPIPPPFRIRFITNEQTLKDIRAAESRTRDLIADSDATLAYYQLHGRVVPTYETGATRKFLRGRTETVRTLSVESKAFVEGMLDKSLSVQQKYDRLQAATKAHTNYSIDASNGKGCDRHLLGLRLLLQKGESHPIFEEPIFAKSQEWLLSTSSLTSGDYFSGTGFGCVYPNGYGINYSPGEHIMKFGIESKFSSSETDTKALKESIIKALRDMRNICEQVNGKPSKL
ncbi:5291_t:CDS:2, partial [Dentiscutata erythropus]